MNVVLYTTDFEPITVLNLPMWLLDQLEKVGQVRVAVPPSPQQMMKAMTESEPPSMPQLDVVDIFCEKLRWKDDTVKTILITPNDELALALRPEWLPGQQASINWYRKTIDALVTELQKQFKKPC